MEVVHGTRRRILTRRFWRARSSSAFGFNRSVVRMSQRGRGRSAQINAMWCLGRRTERMNFCYLFTLIHGTPRRGERRTSKHGFRVFWMGVDGLRSTWGIG